LGNSPTRRDGEVVLVPVVLGIHAFGHEAGACIATPQGLWALSEERLSRVKYDSSFPEKSILWALKASGVGDLKGVDLVVYDLLEQAGSRVLQSLGKLGYTGEVRALRHHEAHAASAFFVSPFEEAPILTIDAGGSREGEQGPGIRLSAWQEKHPMHREVQGRFLGRGNTLETQERTITGPPWTVNPGVLYGLTSEFLGFGSMGSGKVMGLAAFGEPEAGFKKPIFESFDGNLLARCPEDEPLSLSAVQTFLPTLFAGVAPRGSRDPIDKRHQAMAAHVQAEAQRAVLSIVKNLPTPSSRLCFAGGFALNAVTNTAIVRQTSCQNLFVQPAATDAGIPLGCALWGYHVALGQERCFEMRTASLGGEYTTGEIESALNSSSGIIAKQIENIEGKAAEEISRGKIIGWVSGRSEFGPRALGHRSIFADPRQARSVERLNAEIKFREPFRPYAPMVPEESAERYFDLPAPSPFMLLIGPVREEWRPRLPAVTHVDGTARVQTVSREVEPRLVSLLEEFERHSGVDVLLNTSFNRAGEPIVETPADALEVFLATRLDALVLENFWIEKEPG
jgi:carbamoyltransferase